MIHLPRNLRLPGLTASIALFGGLAVFAHQREAGATQTPPRTYDPIIAGAFDIHTHPAPDSQERSIDAVEYARMVKESGMRGFIFKQHDDQTAGLVYLVRKAVPGIDAYGAIVLNKSMGGVNVAAVERFAKIAGGWGRFVFMPTRDAATVPVAANGELLPETKAVINAVATLKTVDSNGTLILATGHVGPEESLMILQEAKRVGVQHMVVTHPMGRWSADQMRQAANLGAYLEFTADLAARPSGEGVEERLDRTAEAIRAVGVEHAILSSDLGRADLPVLSPDGLAVFANGLKRKGFTELQLRTMLRDNPYRLVGIDTSAPAGTK